MAWPYRSFKIIACTFTLQTILRQSFSLLALIRWIYPFLLNEIEFKSNQQHKDLENKTPNFYCVVPTEVSLTPCLRKTGAKCNGLSVALSEHLWKQYIYLYIYLLFFLFIFFKIEIGISRATHSRYNVGPWNQSHGIHARHHRRLGVHGDRPAGGVRVRVLGVRNSPAVDLLGVRSCDRRQCRRLLAARRHTASQEAQSGIQGLQGHTSR